MKPEGYYQGYGRGTIRGQDRKYLRWLEGAIVHHDWVSQSNEFLRRAVVEQDVHTFIHHGKVYISSVEWLGGDKTMMYTKVIKATFKLRGTLKEINVMKARIAALSSFEEVYSMSIKEEK